MKQNGWNYAKVKQIPPHPSPFLGKYAGKFYSTWNPENVSKIPRQKKKECFFLAWNSGNSLFI